MGDTTITTFSYEDGSIDLTLERDHQVLLRAELRRRGVDAVDLQVSRRVTVHIAHARQNIATIKDGRIS